MRAHWSAVVALCCVALVAHPAEACNPSDCQIENVTNCMVNNYGCACGGDTTCDPECIVVSTVPAVAGIGCPDDGSECTADVCDGSGNCTHVPIAGAVCCHDADCTNTPPDHGQVACTAGQCGFACEAGYKSCGGACISTSECCTDSDCLAPPHDCYAEHGTCGAGTCTYGYANGTACNADNDACTRWLSACRNLRRERVLDGRPGRRLQQPRRSLSYRRLRSEPARHGDAEVQHRQHDERHRLHDERSVPAEHRVHGRRVPREREGMPTARSLPRGCMRSDLGRLRRDARGRRHELRCRECVLAECALRCEWQLRRRSGS
jgi:hypothetical protein